MLLELTKVEIKHFFASRMQTGFFVCVYLAFFCSTLPQMALGQPDSGVQLRPLLPLSGREPVTLAGAVRMADTAFPKLLQDRAEMEAAKRRITLQKIKEYVPDSMFSYQDVAATHNRLTQTLFSSSVLPATPGPGPENVRMSADAFSAAGFILDWAPIDFGLHKAMIGKAKAEFQLSAASYQLTKLDVSVRAALSYLDALIMSEQVAVAEANVQRFSDFSTVVHAQVNAGLQAGADASLADAQLANARNDLIRAKLNDELARAALGYAIGRGGEVVEIEPGGIIEVTEPDDSQNTAVNFSEHPLSLQSKALISTRLASKKVLDKQYYPKFRWLGGVNLRGTTFLTNRGDVPAPDVSGFFPTVPNWNAGLVVDFPFLDIIRIKAEKRVVFKQIEAAQHNFDLAVQSLKRDDVQARASLRAAVALAKNMPVQVEAASLAARQAEARYQAGLATVAQVAEANQILADSRVKEAVANVGVWKSLLSVANVHGDMQPFLAAAENATRRRKR